MTRIDRAVLLSPDAAAVLLSIARRHEQHAGRTGLYFAPAVTALLTQLDNAVTGGSDVTSHANASTTDPNRDWLSFSTGDQYVSTDDAASLLGCTPGNVRDLARRGAIPARRVGGRWLLNAEAVAHRRRTRQE